MCAARLVPQRLKPQAMRSCHGAAEAAPLESRFLKHAIAIPAFARLVPHRLKRRLKNADSSLSSPPPPHHAKTARDADPGASAARDSSE